MVQADLKRSIFCQSVRYRWRSRSRNSTQMSWHRSGSGPDIFVRDMKNIKDLRSLEKSPDIMITEYSKMNKFNQV